MRGLADHPLAAFSAWLEATPLSHVLQTVDWLIPAIQTLHILCVALVISSVMMLVLGTFGLHGREQPLARTFARFLPGVRAGLAVLLVSGALMIAAEPDRSLPNPVFQLKMALLIVAAALTFAVVRRQRRLALASGGDTMRDAAMRAVAATSLVLWLGVLVAGRWIAYSLSR